jgi:hypothetical protein
MIRRFALAGFLIINAVLTAQIPDSSDNIYNNSADKMLTGDRKLTIGGYGEVHYNQPVNSDIRNNGVLDVHRMVMLFGYTFNSRTQFFTELEFEHVSEVYVEQAFLQYKINSFIKLRGGLLLIPMGIINEFHEPVTFNGVERPLIDTYIVPTTWREIGIGLVGSYLDASLKYQLYVVNGFKSYDGTARLNGKNGLRGGRQRGAESFMSYPNLTGKLEYFGIRGLNIGLSGYYGKTQSTLYDGMNKDDAVMRSLADSSVVGIAMAGLDIRYSIKGLQLKGQYYYSGISNTIRYNEFTGENEKPNDLGKALAGFYVEAGYNIFRPAIKIKSKLIPFVRYEYLDTHHSVDKNIVLNKNYEQSIITTGLTLEITRGAVVKADMQFSKPASTDKLTKVFNAGIGIMF